ncbi:HET domain-containing protein [Xylaria flabelliformis]|nr:HET domain-containing protein [Xylaria flabelliformis]
MRLLSRDDTGLLSLEEYLPSATNPPYAILSHTWGPDEVTYEDITSRTYLHKYGYRKIRFCAEQAERDRLRHFWVDTCCINKSSSAELSESINSMFSWYRNASKCYAYLEDVSGPSSLPRDRDQDKSQNWRLQFQRSRWFTRAWTLQELIAPATVEFFSGTGKKLGNKASLESLICEVSGIPARVLRGSRLHHYTTTEKMAWAETREATKPEDKAYSLPGSMAKNESLIIHRSST